MEPQIKKPILKPMLIMLLLTGIVFGGILAWKMFTWHMMKQYFATMKAPAVAVSTLTADYQTWQPEIKASGSLNAKTGVDLSSEIAGIVKAVHFVSGAQVKAGDVLVELDNSVDLAHLHSLEATAQLAETVYKRDKALFAVHAISKAALEADAADLKSKTALVAEQNALVAKKTIHAPFDGRLSFSAIDLGAYVHPGDKMVSLQSLDPIYVDFYIPQQAITQVAIDQAISLTTDSYPGKIFSGKITTIDPKIDPSTRTVQVQATLSNADYQLLPGMFASVEITTGAPEQYLTLPQTAISYNPYGETVYIVKQNGKDAKGQPILIAEQHFVTLGQTRGDQVAILSGLTQGDSVITAGQLKLKNGSPIVINNTVLPSNHPQSNPANS